MKALFIPLRLVSALLLLCFGAGAVYASAGLPVIASGPPPIITTTKGDTVSLAIVISLDRHMQEENLAVEWKVRGSAICQGLVCEIDTNGLSFGIHQLTIVVANEKGRSVLSRKLAIVKPAAGSAPRVWTPESEQNPTSVVTLVTDLHIESLEGIPFIDSADGRKPINGPTPINSDIEVIAGLGAVAKLQQADLVEHYVLAESRVRLFISEAKLQLKEGASRHRFLQPKSLLQSVVSDAVNIIPDHSGVVDIVLWCDKDVVSGAVIAGSVRIESKQGDILRATRFLQGDTFSVNHSTGIFELNPAVDVNRIERLILASTPGWKLGTPTQKPKENKSLYLSTWLKDRRFEMVIQTLSHLPIKEMTSAERSALCQAYLAVYLVRQCENLLTNESVLGPEENFLLGYAALLRHDHEKAYKHFAQSYKFEGPHLLEAYYYSAVSAFNTGRLGKSRQLFVQASWLTDEYRAMPQTEPLSQKAISRLSESSEKFLEAIELGKSWSMIVDTAGVYNSNILRARDPASPPQPETVGSGAGYFARIDSAWHFSQSENHRVSFNFDLSKQGWLEPTLGDAETLEMVSALDFRFELGGEQKRRFIRYSLRPGIAIKDFGSVRAANGVFGDMEVASPAFYGIGAGLVSTVWRDPHPGYADLYDPARSEGTRAIDQTGKRLAFRLFAAPTFANFSMRFVVETADTYYAVPFAQEDANKEWSLAGYLERLSGRHNYGCGLAGGSRRFGSSTDNRVDRFLRLAAFWHWSWTPFLKVVPEATYTSNASTRSSATYSAIETKIGTRLIL